jgi:hypothetical protein
LAEESKPKGKKSAAEPAPASPGAEASTEPAPEPVAVAAAAETGPADTHSPDA